MKFNRTLITAATLLASTAFANDFRSADVHNSDDYPAVAAVNCMSDLLAQRSGGKH